MASIDSVDSHPTTTCPACGYPTLNRELCAVCLPEFAAIHGTAA
jgi:hypothetical protein